ncbi:hypothetical protein NKI66_19505 [Mesorhizobium sp. M0518]|uniref:hypothetical protein n=1 Tax=Mesorhizobium sp. M0518 TaxID=2956956 RepID=UPI003337213E
MANYVSFQMWGPFRQSLIKGHQFYVEQARKRVLSQFENIEEEADKTADDWLEESGGLFDPDRHDPSDFYKAANDFRIEFYQLLSHMRDQTRLSVVAGMFHEWVKKLREWLVREIQHWHHGETVVAKVWSADFGKITDLLESFGWKLRRTDYFKTLDACRLVVNVYKHGTGTSLADLKATYPEYPDDPLKGVRPSWSKKLVDHKHLKVSDDQFEAFSHAILAFWRDVPENVVGGQELVPSWFEKAILSDRATRRAVSAKVGRR